MSINSINTHNLIINFGKHKGAQWTRLPVSYLRWLANECNGEKKDTALAELYRRGTTMPTTLELSGHAIDRASQITKQWDKIGVHSWLLRIADEALAKANGKEEVVHDVFKFVFQYGDFYPVLKTIIKVRRHDEVEAS